LGSRRPTRPTRPQTAPRRPSRPSHSAPSARERPRSADAARHLGVPAGRVFTAAEDYYSDGPYEDMPIPHDPTRYGNPGILM
jgi:hypothetical protein